MHAVQQRRAKGGERAPLFGKVVRRMDAFLSVWEKRRIAAAVSRAVDRGRKGDWGLLWAPTDVEGLPGWVGGQAGALLWRRHVSREWVSPILDTHVYKASCCVAKEYANYKRFLFLKNCRFSSRFLFDCRERPETEFANNLPFSPFYFHRVFFFLPVRNWRR